MIIPVRCFTCGKVLADKWSFYKRECVRLIETARKTAEAEAREAEKIEKTDKKNDKTKNVKTEIDSDSVSRAEIFVTLHLGRMCCRRHLLGHVDLMDKI